MADIDNAKVQLAKRIKRLEDELAEARTQFDSLETADSIIRSLEASGVLPRAPIGRGALFDVSPSLNRRRAKTGLTEKVLSTVLKFNGEPLSPPRVRDEIIKGGFQAKSKNFSVHVANILKRLADRGLIQVHESARANRHSVYPEE